MAIKRREKKEENLEDWLTTYADAVTLLLCFFIILFGMSKPEEEKFKQISEVLAQAGFTSDQEKPEDAFEVLQEELQVLIESSQLEEHMSVEQTEKGIQLELSSSSFYHSGSARFKKEAIPILQQVADVLSDFNYDAYAIAVDGHTDDVPISSDVYPSNWELSGGRAANVVRFLIASGLNKDLMQAIGFADVQPKVPNLDESGVPIPMNRELNRRVVIRVERID